MKDVRTTYNQNTRTISPQTYTEAGADFDEPQWDRISIDPTELLRELFVIPIGQTDPIGLGLKTVADTSIRAKGTRKNEAFRVFGFAMKYLPQSIRTVAEIQSINELFSETLFEFFINSRNQYGICMLDFIMGDPLPVVVSLGAGDNFNYSSLGRRTGYWPLNLTIPLANLTDFSVSLRHVTAPAAGLTGDLLKIEMVGIKTRLAIS